DHGQPKAPAGSVVHDLHPHAAAARVHQGVPGQLARHGHHLGLVDQRQPQLRRGDPDLPARQDDVAVGGDGQFLPFGAHPGLRAWLSISMAWVRLRAVRTPPMESPSSTIVIATAGRMPTTTVSASRMRVMAAMVAKVRPMKESTTSTAEMSMMTPRARAATAASARSSCSASAS